MDDERDRLNNIIDDHGLKIGHVQVMERRNESYARVYDALAAKLVDVTADRNAILKDREAVFLRAEAAEAKLAEVTAERDALVEAANIYWKSGLNPNVKKFDAAIHAVNSSRAALGATDVLRKRYLARAEAAEAALKTARRDALEEVENIANAVMKKYAKETYSDKTVKVFTSNGDTPAQSAAKTYCAGEILEAIRALIEDENQDDQAN